MYWRPNRILFHRKAGFGRRLRNRYGETHLLNLPGSPPMLGRGTLRGAQCWSATTIRNPGRAAAEETRRIVERAAKATHRQTLHPGQASNAWRKRVEAGQRNGDVPCLSAGKGCNLNDHRCRAGKLCAARSGTDPAATTRPDTLCAACVNLIQSQRDQLLGYRKAVAVMVGIKPVTAQASKVSGSREPQSPLNLAAETLATDIDEVLSRVRNYLVRDLVSRPPEQFKAWRHDVEQIVLWDGVDLALQIAAVHGRAAKMLGFERQWVGRTAPCWGCGMPTLGQFTGSSTVECSGCGARKTDVDYESYCVELIRGKK